jgi:hypothetical protein
MGNDVIIVFRRVVNVFDSEQHAGAPRSKEYVVKWTRAAGPFELVC